MPNRGYVSEGSSHTLLCRSDASPSPQYTWSRADGRPLSSNFRQSDGRSVCVIISITSQWTLRATDVVGFMHGVYFHASFQFRPFFTLCNKSGLKPKVWLTCHYYWVLNSGEFFPGLQSSRLKLGTCYMMGSQGIRYISFYTSNQFTCSSVVLVLFILTQTVHERSDNERYGCVRL